jgi:sensor histidine kinase YesM
VRIPEKVRVGYIDFKVIMQNQEVTCDNVVVYGKISNSDGEIVICDIYNEDQKKATFLHECIHGMSDCNDIGLSEKQIKKLGIAFYEFIKDNPEIFKENE